MVMPIFAFVNAGIPISPGVLTGELLHPVTLGVVFGLLFGKFIGVSTASFLAVRLKIAHLPKDVGLRHIFGAGFVAGIGFTMSIFIAGLAFREAPELLRIAKMGILTGSIIAGSVGYIFLRIMFREKVHEHPRINTPNIPTANS